ncbi:MAG: glycosyltransferase, partial [Candidatus Pacebacteria bacterium]|nr:glycosyltransferase [Candidatus Paceibacterota bacterium]
ELRRELSLESDAPVVGFVGRLCTQKDPLSSVLAARKCADTHPGTQFIVAGDGPLRRDVEEAVDCLGLRKQCHVLGHRTDMDRILGLIDVLVQPSLWEGLPYVVLDAMARGKAVVASEVGGLGDVIKPGNNGMLVPVRDPDAVAETIGRLLGDTELRASLGRHARATVAGSYRLQDILAALRHLYGSLRSIDRAGVPRCVE